MIDTTPVTSPLTSTSSSTSSSSAEHRAAARTVFVPVLLLTLALLGWFAFQSTQLVREQQQLGQAHIALEAQNAGAIKLRTSLDAVATATAKLAAEGNSNARVIVGELRKRGITINPAAPASQAVSPK